MIKSTNLQGERLIKLGKKLRETLIFSLSSLSALKKSYDEEQNLFQTIIQAMVVTL